MFIWRVIWLLQRSWNVAHTALNLGYKIYHLFAELIQNHGGYTFKDNSEVWTSVNREQKNLFQGTINASVLEVTSVKAEE
jgi:hypothetical protein